MTNNDTSQPENSNARNPLVTPVAVVVGAVLIVVSAIFAPDSIAGGEPTGSIIALRTGLLAACFGTYAGVMLYYSKRNEEFRKHLEETMNAPTKKKKKGKS